MTEVSRNKSILDIYLATRDYPEEYSPHYHYYHQMIFVTEGIAQFDIEGKHYIVKPNSFLLVSDFESHSLKVLEPPYKRYVLAMNSEFAINFLKHPLLLSVFLRRPDNFCNLINLDQETADKVAQICFEMTQEIKAKDTFWEENAASMVLQMLISVYRYSSETFWPDNTSTASKLIFQVQKYISQNYHMKLGLDEISKEFFINKYYLSHIFKSVTGFTYKEYLIQYRLSIAKDLLVNSKMSVTDVCAACGYNNINHFIRIFKVFEGITPTKYRRNPKPSEVA